MTGQGVMLALLLCFIMLPVWQAYRWHVAGRHSIGWADVGWLMAYFVVGFTVLFKILRPILILGVNP